MPRPLKSSLVAALALAAAAAGCGEEKPVYKPRGAPSAKATLPPVPNVPKKPIKDGDAYTVWGASYYLRSRVHQKEVKGKEITIVGYVVKTNLPDAPACAVHKAGKADPEGCVAPFPAFWIADSKDADLKEAMQVKGWASNFAQIYDAIEHFDKEAKKDKPEPYTDTFWAVEIPNPLPIKGMKVRITGDYASTFTKGSLGAEADPIMGMLTFKKWEILEKIEEAALLPGMKKK